MIQHSGHLIQPNCSTVPQPAPFTPFSGLPYREIYEQKSPKFEWQRIKIEIEENTGWK